MLAPFSFLVSSIVLSFLSSTASAALPTAIDVTTATDFIEGPVMTALIGLGVVMIALAALAMGLKWLKGMAMG